MLLKKLKEFLGYITIPINGEELVIKLRRNYTMKKQEKKGIGKKIIAGIAVGCLALGGLGGYAAMPEKEVMVEKVVTNETAVEQARIEGFSAGVESVEPVIEYVDVEVEKEVKVDNGNLEIVLDEIYDNDGSVEYLTEDLDDDELDKIVDRIVFVNDIKKLAVDEVVKEGVEELDKEEVELSDNSTIELDEDDIERFKVYDDADEVSVDVSDYEDGDAYVTVEAKFEQDEIKMKAVYEIKIRDGSVDDISLESIEERD